MQKELKAALAAAKKYTPRNAADRVCSEQIINLLSDAHAHSEQLDDLADAHDRAERVRLAQQELNAAQSA